MATEIGQLDRFALDAGQLGYRLAHSFGRRQVEYFLLQIVAGLRHAPGALLAGPAARFRAQDVDGPPMGHREQESAQRPACRVEPFGLAPQADKDLLGHLFGQHGVENEALGQTEHSPGVAPVDLGQRLLLPARHGHGQAGVARCREVRDHRHLFAAGDRNGRPPPAPPMAVHPYNVTR